MTRSLTVDGTRDLPHSLQSSLPLGYRGGYLNVVLYFNMNDNQSYTGLLEIITPDTDMSQLTSMWITWWNETLIKHMWSVYTRFCQLEMRAYNLQIRLMYKWTHSLECLGNCNLKVHIRYTYLSGLHNIYVSSCKYTHWTVMYVKMNTWVVNMPSA